MVVVVVKSLSRVRRCVPIDCSTPGSDEGQVQRLVQQSVLKDTWCNKFERGSGKAVDPEEKLDSQTKRDHQWTRWETDTQGGHRVDSLRARGVVSSRTQTFGLLNPDFGHF